MVEVLTKNDVQSDSKTSNADSEHLSRQVNDLGLRPGEFTKSHAASEYLPSGKSLPDGSLIFGDVDNQQKDRKFGSQGDKQKDQKFGDEGAKPKDQKPGGKGDVEGKKNDQNPKVDEPYTSSGVDQGKFGDCVFEATVASLAKTGKLDDMIKDNPDGSHTVTFPGDKDHPVNVTEEDLKKYGTSDSAKWARILETALVKEYPDVTNGGNPPKNAPGGTDGNQPTPAQYSMYLLTGQTAGKTDATTDNKVGDKINTSMENNRAVTVNCKDDNNGALVSGHEWSVEGYDPKTGQITLRNPWGSNPDSDASKSGVTNLGDGKVSMSLNDFKKYYGEVTFAS